MKRFFISSFLILFLHTTCFSQAKDSTRICFSVDLVQLSINELAMHVDYQFNKRNAFGFGAGYIYPRKALQVNKLSSDQGPNPGAVWYGWVTRANYTFYFKNNSRKYFELQFMRKQLHFDNQGFENYEGDGDFVYFRRTEKASLSGLDFIWGKQKSSLNSNFDCEIFGGIGFRIRNRKGTNLYCSVPGLSPPFPIGPYHYDQFYPMAIFGIKMGLNGFFRKSWTMFLPKSAQRIFTENHRELFCQTE